MLIESYGNLPLVVLTPPESDYVVHVKAAHFRENCRQFCELPPANASNLMFSHHPPPTHTHTHTHKYCDIWFLRIVKLLLRLYAAQLAST